ncbi:MAG: anti-sigma factor family protein [Gaiellaceae bacterium]
MTQAANTYEELSCQELVELVTDYFEGALPEELHARFEEHIAHCAGCSTYVEQMRLTIAATGTLAREAISPEAERTLLAAFRNWNRSG